jgi:hypothetical protein
VHIFKTEPECIRTGFVNVWLVSYTKRILFSSQYLACRRHVQASGRGCDCRLVLFLCDGLNSICIIGSKLGIVDHLSVDFDARVDESNSVDVELNSGPSDTAVSDFIVLLLKVVGIDCVVMSSVRLAPNTEAVAL